MCFFSMPTPALSSLKQNLEKSDILGKLMKLHCRIKEYFSIVLYLQGFFCLFQHRMHQSTNMFNYHGNDSKVDRSVCSDPDESFGYYDVNQVQQQRHKDESLTSNEESNSTVRKQWKCSKGKVKEETFMKSNIDRSSHQRCSVKKFIKKRPQPRCFAVTLAKFLSTRL